MGSYASGDRPERVRTASGSKWRRIVKAMLSARGTICIVCLHGGSDAADHLLPVRERPDLEWEVGNLRPIHHRPCPVCTEAARRINPEAKPVRCNYIKGYGTLETAQRIVSERTGLAIGQVSHETPGDEGTGWW
jgi:hypothetical protein